MNLKFDHIGVAARDLARGRQFLQCTLNITRWTGEYVDPGIGVIVQFGQAGNGSGPWYELIAPYGNASPVAAAIKSGKNILNHVAYFVDNLEEAGAHLREQRCFPASEAQPAVAYRGRRVQFFVTPLKFMIELIEGPDPKELEGEVRVAA